MGASIAAGATGVQNVLGPVLLNRLLSGLSDAAAATEELAVLIQEILDERTANGFWRKLFRRLKFS